MKFYTRSLFEEEFKKRRARLSFEHQYLNRGSYSGYFTKRDHSAQAVCKFIHHHGNVKDLIAYVTDPKKTGSDQNIFSPQGARLSKQKLKETTQFWSERNKLDSRANARHSTHIILSTKQSPTPENGYKLKEVVSNIVSKHFTFNGFDSFFAIHTDKPHLHAHVVVHNKNLISGKKIQFSKFQEMFAIRKDFADELNAAGWNYSSTLRKDAMEVNDGLDGQKKHQNYILHQIEAELGPAARAWAKKQFVLKFSDDDQKVKEAKRNLALIRDFSNPKAKTLVLDKIEKYKIQKRKWEIKQTLSKKYTDIDPKSINSYVDAVFATQDRLCKSYTTKNKRTVNQYNSVSDLANSLTQKDISQKITDFQQFMNQKRDREKEIKALDHYGDIGRQYLKQLYQNLDYAKTDNQRDIVSAKIKGLKNGTVDQNEFDFFRQSLLEHNSKPYRQFFKQRVLSIKKEVAEKSEVDISEITEVERLFTLYCSRRGSDSVYAYRKFKSGIDRYVNVLKSGSDKRIKYFSNSIDKKLGSNLSQQRQKS